MFKFILVYFTGMKVIFQHVVFIFLCTVSYLVHGQENVQTIGELPNEILETSGLIYFNGNLITHNDSGNEAVLYELDTLTLNIQRRVTISNVTNVDWEAITQDEEYIYIGDFGNNVGTRTDLAVYRISKEDYLNSDNVTASIISFSYEDQQDFTNNGNSDWDAEAFFTVDDRLIILTKQWQSLGSVAYEVSKTPGNHVANRVGAIENVGLVTDATYNSESNRLVLIGYSSFLRPFIGIVENFNRNAVFEGYAQQSLELNFTQAEGLTQTNSTSYFFTSEYYSRQSPTIESPSRLFTFEIPEKETDNPDEPENPEDPENPEEPENPDNPEESDNVDKLIIYRNNSSNNYHYSISTEKKVFGQIIYDVSGRQVWVNSGEIEKEGIITHHLESSIYYLTLYLDDDIITTSFAVY